jgi:hypothetical protein
VLTWRVGVASSPAAGKAMAEYLSTELLRPEKEALARYYAGELALAPAREQTEADRLARERKREWVRFGEAIAILAAAESAAGRGGGIVGRQIKLDPWRQWELDPLTERRV